MNSLTTIIKTLCGLVAYAATAVILAVLGSLILIMVLATASAIVEAPSWVGTPIVLGLLYWVWTARETR